MTLPEALAEFEELRGTSATPVPYCCNLPVVMNSQTGITRIYCSTCGRGVKQVGGQWMIENWGSKGIKIFPTAPGVVREVLLDVKDGPEGIKIWRDDERGVVDWHDGPAVYIEVAVQDAQVRLGPFQLATIYEQLKQVLRSE